MFGRKHWRRWLIRLALAGIGLGTGTVSLLAVIIIRYGAVDRARPADVIIVLGGGEVGTTRRAVHAVALYRQGYAPYLLCAGSTVSGQPVSEAARCAQVARENGVPLEAIVLDEISSSTEENAHEAAAIMRAHGWRAAVLVSDNFHLRRATWLFKRAGVRVWPSPAQATTGSLPVSEMAYAVLREIGALGWHTGQSLLRLP